jgi:hypothetical protein
MRTLILRATVAAALGILAGCGQSKPAAADAKKFLDDAEVKLNDLGVEAAKAAWVQENFITDDTEALSAASGQRAGDEAVRLAKQARQFDGLTLPADQARMLNLLKIGFTLAPPSDPKESAEVSKIAASLDATYGKGKYCKDDGKTCLDINDITKIMAASTNPAELLDVWKGWHTISPPMRNTTCPPTISRRSSTACGIRCVPCISRSMPTCARACMRNTAARFLRPDPFPPTCWATSGPRIGPTSISWSRPKTPTPATI